MAPVLFDVPEDEFLEDELEDWCLVPLVVADDVEFEDDFELFKLPAEEEVCWCCNCCRHLARRFLNQTWRRRRSKGLIRTIMI